MNGGIGNFQSSLSSMDKGVDGHSLAATSMYTLIGGYFQSSHNHNDNSVVWSPVKSYEFKYDA